MRPLSAIEAFTPALERTKSLLLPFSWRRWLKFGLVAIVAELGAQFTVPPVGGHHTPQSANEAAALPIAAAVFVVLSLVFLVVSLIFLYIGSRMQFVLVDIVATRDPRVAPSWQRHATATWRWIGLKLLAFLVAFLVLGLIMAVPLITLIRSVAAQGAQPPSPASIGHFVLLFAVIFLAVLMFMVVIWVLRDLIFPFIVFENATLANAVRAGMDIVRREPIEVLFYLLMKLVFTIAAGILAEFTILIALLVGAIPLGLIGGALWLSLRHAVGIGMVILYVSLALLAILLVAWLIAIGICVIGATLIFYQAYALYFLGGRYQLLGDLLEPPQPGYAYAPAPPPPLPNWPPPLPDPTL